MKKILFIIVAVLHFMGSISAQNTDDLLENDVFRKAFLESCISEAKSQKLSVNAKVFCTCSFENLMTLIKDSGIDFSDENAVDKITQSKEYEDIVFSCFSGNNVDALETEYVKICAKNLSKDKFMRKNTDVNEVCHCTYTKIKDGPYTMVELNQLPAEKASEYYQKISEECIKFYLESKGVNLE